MFIMIIQYLILISSFTCSNFRPCSSVSWFALYLTSSSPSH